MINTCHLTEYRLWMPNLREIHGVMILIVNAMGRAPVIQAVFDLRVLHVYRHITDIKNARLRRQKLMPQRRKMLRIPAPIGFCRLSLLCRECVLMPAVFVLQLLTQVISAYRKAQRFGKLVYFNR